MDAPARPHLAHWPRRLPHALVVPETTLWFNLEVSAARYPHKPASLFFGQTLSFLELKRQAEALAGWLQAQGVGRGDRVALFLQNCPQFLIAFYAVMRCDAVASAAPARRVGRRPFVGRGRVTVTAARRTPAAARWST